MCGIAGIIGSDDAALMERMTDRIAHRGPDDAGMRVFKNVPRLGDAVLGHRRLSIIDLSTAGRQPMSNEDGTVWVVFNGEIYNFDSLRRELTSLGHRFVSRTDTEVIVHGYEQWGAACVERFDGMFAFAVLDTGRGELLLVRDRLGIKPLYVTSTGSRFAFASEIKALLEVPGVAREIDPDALDLYLALGYVPGPRSMFRGIRKLQPGTMLRLSGDQPVESTYWSPPINGHCEGDPDEQAHRLHDEMSRSVTARLVSDVPVGCFLSGGLDSGVIAALMTGQLDTRRTLKTFCLGYDRRAHRHDERDDALDTARHLGVDHHEVVCTKDFAVQALPWLAWHLDEPIGEELLASFATLCGLARQDVTVVLSGEGADELLFGYRYYALEGVRRWMRLMPRMVRAAARAALSRLAPAEHLRTRALRCCLRDTQMASFLDWSMRCSPRERSALFGDALSGWANGRAWDEAVQAALPCPPESGAYLAPAVDARYRMVDYILSKNDKLSMAFGLELRVPFLDHRVVEFAATVPTSHKIHGCEGKQILRRAAAPLLPPETVRRRKKPFAAPVNDWLPSIVQRYLRPGLLVADGVLRGDAVAKLVERRLTADTDHGKLWAVIMAEVWYRVFIRQDPETLDRIAEGPAGVSAALRGGKPSAEAGREAVAAGSLVTCEGGS